MGCGTVAGYGHLPALRAATGLELVSLYDPDPSNLKEKQERFGVAKAFTDVEAFFRSGIEAVTITSPAPCHLANLCDAARHGKHVLCEKPLAMNDAEAREMTDTARRAGIMLFTGFDYRFSPVSQEILRLVREGVVGEVRALRLVYIWHCHGKYETGPDGKRVEQARRAARMEEGGPLVDCGVHQIDLARFWTGSEVKSWGVAGAWVDEYEAPDHVWLHMEHECGTHTTVEMSYSFCHTAAQPLTHFTYQLIGTEGLIHYDFERHIFEVRSEAGTRQLPFGPVKNFEGMYDAFARALATGSSAELPTAEDGMAAVAIARGATEELIRRRRAGAR